MQKIRVLLLDGDPEMANRIQGMASPLVGEIRRAADGESGMALWREWQPDITVSEIELAGGDGLLVCERIKADDPDAAIVLVSAAGGCQHLQRAINIGVDGFLGKPLVAESLVETLQRCVRKRQRVIDLKLGRRVFEVANEGIMVTDGEPRILAVNPAFSRITGYRPDEVVGQRTNLLSGGLHGKDYYRSMWDSLQSHGRWEGEITNRRKDGSLFSEWLSIAELDGEVAHAKRYVGLFSDISNRKREEELIRRLAHFDSLTGLPNRVLFYDRLQRSLARARRYGQSLAVLYVDLDHFKEINDTFGHAIGDDALRTAASRMSSVLRQCDTVSRRGGDEFVVIVELDGHSEGLGSVCQKLLRELSRPMGLGPHVVELGASIGAAGFPLDAEEPEALLAAADSALYEAKASGRGHFRFYRPDAQKTACTRLDMERELRDGLRNWRYSLCYLPEISLVSGELENVEALLRFHHPEFGILEAGRFLEIAEDMGIMPELGQKALAQAVREISTLTESYPDLGLVVDLSARQLSDPDAVERLLDTLVRAGMPTSCITFECPESAVSGNDMAMETLFKLAASGCKFTLDDFGSGYCSFSLLCQLPMTSIKIDRSFTSEIDSNPQIRELVAALVAFSKRLGLRTVAEGVESPAQLAFLLESRCDAVQGYVFGKPMTGEALKVFLEEENWRCLVS